MAGELKLFGAFLVGAAAVGTFSILLWDRWKIPTVAFNLLPSFEVQAVDPGNGGRVLDATYIVPSASAPERHLCGEFDVSSVSSRKEEAYIIGDTEDNLRSVVVVRYTHSGISKTEYTFIPNCPFSQASDPNLSGVSLNKFVCCSIAPIGNTGSFIAAFHDLRLASVLVVFDANGKEMGRLWHPGHVYEVRVVGDKIYAWGKLNAIQRGKLLTNDVPPTFDYKTQQTVASGDIFHNPVVFCISLKKLIQNGNELIGPLPNGYEGEGWQFYDLVQFFNKENSQKLKFAKFDWYYAFDIKTPVYDGFLLQAEKNKNQVAFESIDGWKYTFDQRGLVSEPEKLSGAKNASWNLLKLIPRDESGEFGQWCSNVVTTISLAVSRPNGGRLN